MVLVIDTAGVLSALALVVPGQGGREEVVPARRGDDLAARVKALAGLDQLDAVCVASGPGSFAGVRSGVSFGVGLALGLGLPLMHLGSLEIQAARAPVPVLAVGEAGRGRVYNLAPGAEPALDEVGELPTCWPVSGWLHEATAGLLSSRGLQMLPAESLISFSEAAAKLVQSAPVVAYDKVPIHYLSAFGRVRN